VSSKKRILFVCTANSCRSQIAEGIANHLYSDTIEARSGGSRPSSVHPLAIQVMAEIGVDISHQRNKSVAEFVDERFDYVISLCGDHSQGTCPVFAGETHTSLNWSLPDPAEANGTHEERLRVFREVRDHIRTRIEAFVREMEREGVVS